MSDFSDYSENAIINALLRGGTLTGAGTVYMALFTAAPTDAGGGTECSYSGYARQSITFSSPSGGATANSNTLTYPAVAGSSQTIVAFAVFDASSAGNMLIWKTLASSVTYAVSDIPIISPGAATFAVQ